MALNQPVLPGKLILWTLLMISLVSWSILISKGLSLRAFRRSDLLFTRRLRRSRTTLEVFEEGWKDLNSLHHEIYLEGAKVAAFLLLGSKEPQGAIQNRARKGRKLSKEQLETITLAFHRGLEMAAQRLEIGLPALRISAVAAPLIGLTGTIWMLMRGFDAANTFEEIAPWVSGSLSYLVFSLLVSIPAAIGFLFFRAAGRERRRELNKFACEITRLFERTFSTAGLSSASDHSAGSSGDKVDREEKLYEGAPPAEKEYHSVRSALANKSDQMAAPEIELRSFHCSSEEDFINPIARQASTTMQPACSSAFE